MSSLLALLTLFVLIGAVLVGGVFFVTYRSTEELDAGRSVFVLSFPSDLEHDRVLAWLRATSRTLYASRFGGSQSMVFETVATDSGIEHRLHVPYNKQDDIIPQLRALAPGVSVVPENAHAPIPWTCGVEIGLTNKSVPLYVPNVQDVTTSILASLQPLRSGEAVIIQWVVRPAPQTPLPHRDTLSNQFTLVKQKPRHDPAKDDEIKERRAKLEEPNVMAVLRVAARAKKPEDAERLISRVKTSYKALQTPHNAFYKVMSTQSGILSRVKVAASLLRWPAQLNMTELSAVIAWPIGNPHVSGLPRGASRQLPAIRAVPRQGLVFGTSTFPGDQRPVGLDFAEASKHMWISAPTGTGKTTLMVNLAMQVMASGHGMLLIETKNDLFNMVIDRVPSSRLNDVVVMDVNDDAYPVGFNVLDVPNPMRTLDELETILANIYEGEKGIWLKEVLYHGIRTLMTRPGATLTDLPALLSPRYDEVEWRDELIRSLTDPELLDYWKRLDNAGPARRDQLVAPVLSRLWQFNARPNLRHIFGQRRSTFNLEQSIKDGKIILVNITGVEKDAATIIGSMFVNSAWNAVRGAHLDKPFFLMADEVQNLMHLPIGMNELLAQARSFKLAVIMANQSLDQLPAAVTLAAKANARTKLTFQLEEPDATTVAGMFGSSITKDDLKNLNAYEGFARVSTSEGVSPPFSFKALNEPNAGYMTDAVTRASRAQYARNADEVEEELRAWRRAAPAVKRKRPTISGDDWV